MKLNRKHETATTDLGAMGVWPADTLDEIDDEAFARAIAEGRAAEQRELVDA
jgi:hypothetical protein